MARAPYQIQLLGGFRLTHCGEALAVASAKQKALMAFLAVADKPVPRAQLTDLLWGSRFDEQARQSLRQALSRLRVCLADCDPIATQGDYVGLCAGSTETDVAAFRGLVAAESIDALKSASQLYMGEFLDGLSISEEGFEHWRTTIATELRDLALQALIDLSLASREHCDFAQAIAAAQRAISLDELREDAHRALISSLAGAGRRADAVRHGLQLEQMLRKELGTGLDPQTRELLAEVQRREAEPAAVSKPHAAVMVGASSPDIGGRADGAQPVPDAAIADWPEVPDGKPVSPKPAATAGEHREITVLAYRLAGSKEALSSAELDELWELSRTFHDQAAQAVAARGGILHQLLGDSGIAFFGFPKPEEDTAAGAVSAALDLVARSQTLQQNGRPAGLQVQVGIATSRAVVSSDAASDRVSVVGLAPKLAGALQTQAQPGTVLVDKATWQRTNRQFRFEFGGTVEVDRLPEAQEIWRAIERKPQPDRFSASANRAAPILARGPELSTAADRWQKAAVSRGQVILIEGEPGIGKSRLLHEIRVQAGVGSRQFLVFQCAPRRAASMLHPVVDRIAMALTRHSAGAAELSYPAVARLLQRTGIADQEAIETFAFLVGANGPAEERFHDEPPQKIHDEAIKSVRRCLEDMTSRGPLLLAAEDIHWADPTTQDLLVELMEWIHQWPILLVLTSRTPALEDWLGEPYLTHLRLSRLDRDNAESLIQATAEQEDLGALPPAAVEAIYNVTDGVPLFVEELTRWFSERSRAGEQDWGRMLAEEDVGTLGSLLSARLGALGEAKWVAQAASAIGRRFDAALLSAIVAAERGPEELSVALDGLMKAGIIRRTRQGPNVGYAFRHSLLRKAAHESLLRRERQKLHQRIFQAVMSDPDKAGWMDRVTLAEHAEEAGLVADAIGLFIQAGKESSARSALAEARQLLERALALVPQVEAGDARDRLQLTAMAALGPILTSTEGSASPRARDLYGEAVALARQRPADEQAEWFPIYWGWWYTGSDFGIQSQRAREILSNLKEIDNDELQLQVRHCIWAIDFNLGRHDSCLAAIREGLELYRPDAGSQHRTLFGGHDAKVCALAQRGLSLWLTGAPISAAESMSDAGAWARQTGHVGTVAHALDFEAVLGRYRQDPAAVARAVSEMAEFACQHGLVSLNAKSLIFRGWVEARSGEANDALAQIVEGFTMLRDIEMQVDFPIYNEILAEVYGRCGDPERGLSTIANAVQEMVRTSHLYWLPELHRRRAKLASQFGLSVDDVILSLDRALSIAAEQKARMLLIRSYLTALELSLDLSMLKRWRQQVDRALSEMERDSEVEAAAEQISATPVR